MSVRYDINRAELEPQFDSDIYDVLAGSLFSWVVTYGRRSTAEQTKLHDAYLKGGPLAAPPGHSAHEFGLAVDVAVLTPNGPSWSYSEPQWKWLWETCAKHPRLHSGHDFNDDDHIQAFAWYRKRDELKAAGKW